MGLIQIGRHSKDGSGDINYHDDRKSGELGEEGVALAHDLWARLLCN